MIDSRSAVRGDIYRFINENRRGPATLTSIKVTRIATFVFEDPIVKRGDDLGPCPLGGRFVEIRIESKSAKAVILVEGPDLSMTAPRADGSSNPVTTEELIDIAPVFEAKERETLTAEEYARITKVVVEVVLSFNLGGTVNGSWDITSIPG